MREARGVGASGTYGKKAVARAAANLRLICIMRREITRQGCQLPPPPRVAFGLRRPRRPALCPGQFPMMPALSAYRVAPALVGAGALPPASPLRPLRPREPCRGAAALSPRQRFQWPFFSPSTLHVEGN
ncbi:unnamed protein product, partial [Iphiclides podalirius]